jgi:hypothetical protein
MDTTVLMWLYTRPPEAEALWLPVSDALVVVRHVPWGCTSLTTFPEFFSTWLYRMSTPMVARLCVVFYNFGWKPRTLRDALWSWQRILTHPLYHPDAIAHKPKRRRRKKR